MSVPEMCASIASPLVSAARQEIKHENTQQQQQIQRERERKKTNEKVLVLLFILLSFPNCLAAGVSEIATGQLYR